MNESQLTTNDHKELKIWREYAADKTRSDEEREKARKKIDEIMGKGLEGRLRELEKKVDDLENRIVEFIGSVDMGSIDPPKKSPATGLKSEATVIVTNSPKPAAKKGTKKPLPGKPGGAGGPNKPLAGKPPADDIQF